MGGSHQHRLIAQPAAVLRLGQHRVDHGSGLRGGVVTSDQPGTTAAGAVRMQHQPVTGRMRSHRVGQVQQSLPGPEVAFQPDHVHVRERRRQVQQVGAIGTAERVHRLCVVADDRQSTAVRTQCPHDVDLGLIDILVLVDQHMVPAGRDLGSQHRVGEQTAPGEQQVVEVDQPALAFSGDVPAQQRDDLLEMRLHPTEFGRATICRAGRPVLTDRE